MKFRKKPVIIEAEQFVLKASEEGKEWINPIPEVYQDETSSTGWSINTLEGKHEVTPNDWIITGVKNEKYPCKPDIFQMTYEKVE